ncbi:hypothetical protein ASPZODRAFT_129661 [Penicilliopsis zonata CBS 506.65]|uniref:Uncharacterized protein n=1 Tax=Penicilliopsis zonata CBS 506.65 TaxID=1073090 RepID=A0A1L9SQ86_9EURO|nr:hypothetical protein ASPZODRAFT_129661 [Penicilliopsis zonata CBS 506.65]OJJ49243.1 hypothetical protein ASPZODRAFT_129661 [Penicilliopsis zonata CBS 506.65]
MGTALGQQESGREHRGQPCRYRVKSKGERWDASLAGRSIPLLFPSAFIELCRRQGERRRLRRLNCGQEGSLVCIVTSASSQLLYCNRLAP